MGAADPRPPRRAPSRRRSTVAATFSLRSPVSPVIHVGHTPHEGKGGGRTTKRNRRRPRPALSWGAGAAARGGAGWTPSRAVRGERGRGRSPPDVSPGGRGVGSREEIGRACARRRRGGGPGEARPKKGGERRRGPEEPWSAATLTPAGGLSRYLPAGRLRAPPGLSRPPASGARKRPHIAGGRAGGARLPSSVLPRLRLLLLRRRKLVWSLGPRRQEREGGQAVWLTAAQRRAGSAGARFAAAPAAATAMAEPTGLRPGPGKPRLRGDGDWVPG